MGRTEDKLSRIFNDDEVDDILGSVTTKSAVKRTPACGVERNFADVMTFYETHNRLPVPDSGNDAEEIAWTKWDGIRTRDHFRAQVSHLDQYGLLDISVDNAEGGALVEPVEGPSEKLSQEEQIQLDTLRQIDVECDTQIQNMRKVVFKPLREALSMISHGLSVEVFSLDTLGVGDKYSRDKAGAISQFIVDSSEKLKALAGQLDATINELAEQEASVRQHAEQQKAAVPSPSKPENAPPRGPSPPLRILMVQMVNLKKCRLMTFLMMTTLMRFGMGQVRPIAYLAVIEP